VSVKQLEMQLDSFDPAQRKRALTRLCEMAARGDVDLPHPGSCVNLHCHTFFSYNAYGYSPGKYAWMARKAGLAVAGIVEFDVLDGLDEFIEAGRMLDLKVCVGLESRVFIPEFATRVINSPGEPGISYHMGIGFPSANLENGTGAFLQSLRDTSADRNRALIDRVDRHLSPLELDYDNDLLPLTPSGNATERHICLAYVQKAHSLFGDGEKLAAFWSEKLSTDAGALDLPTGPKLQGELRAKTMKRGGVGYVKPDKGSFPDVAKMNRFVLDAGAIPAHTWLNGMSDGEQALDELLEVAISHGAAALNIIPDRNYTPGVKDELVANLYQIVKKAGQLDLPIIVGTEMNSPGTKFVDSFETDELKPLAPLFLKGAHIVYAHSVLQRECGTGYLSGWAKTNFNTTGEKNTFFESVGQKLSPGGEDILHGLDKSITPNEILNKLK
jgi:hypothetical protein